MHLSVTILMAMRSVLRFSSSLAGLSAKTLHGPVRFGVSRTSSASAACLAGAYAPRSLSLYRLCSGAWAWVWVVAVGGVSLPACRSALDFCGII